MASPYPKDFVADYNKVLRYPKDAAFVIPGGADKKLVWVPYASEFGFTKAELVEDKGNQKFVKLDSGEEKTLDAKDVHDMNPAKFEGVEDMSELGYLNEPSVLFNLQQRYNKDLIYTYSGLFLVAINPYKHLPIYTNNIVEVYCGKRRNEVAPHIFAIADTAYRSMLNDRRDQSLLITGESGAGKTENTKKVIQYIASVAGRAGGQGKLEQQLIELNPFLEAFGNAKTCRNNNSSRFGKFIKLEFNHAGNVAGASLKSYLLEKSRVIQQGRDERNYHIFYQLLAGATPAERQKYHLVGPEQYNFLNKSGCYTVERMNDVSEFEHTKTAMKTCDIDENDQDHIFRVISAILWLGNLPFEAGPGDAAVLKKKDELNIIAELLSVSAAQLEEALLSPVIMAGRDTVKTRLNVSQAYDSRDALVKALYGRLFLWLVNRANEVLCCPNPASFIGVLDISGFEIFEDNNFEQLCINYTNEQLQQFFNNHMFQLEQDEYEAEKIEWNRVDFKIDGQAVIDLIDRKPNGLLILLDEESVFPNGSDDSLLQKLFSKHQHNPNFQKPRFGGENEFAIRHYAGEVKYTTKKWLEKNRDPLQNDLEKTIKSSTNRFVANLFSEALAAGGGSTVALNQRKKGAQFLTVGSAYKEQLGDLMATLRSTNPHFVRCILPNHRQRPGSIEASCVLEQLRCNGVLQGINITRMGWPNRVKYDEFLKRYYLLADGVPRTSADPKSEVRKIITALNVPPTRVQFGLTKIFFRTGELAKIEELRESKIGELLIVIQAACRGWIARTTYNKLTDQSKSARIIQSNLRNYLELKDWLWGKLFVKVKPLLKRRNFEAEIAEKEAALKDTNAKLRKEQEEREALAGSVKTLQNELSMISNRFQEAEESINALRRAKTALESEKQELNLELDEERNISSELAAVKRNLESRAKDLEAQLSSEQDQKNIIQTQLDNLSRALDQLKHTLEERDARITSLETESSTLKNQLQDAEFELETKDDNIEALTQRENGLKKTVAALKQDLEEAEEKSHQLNDAKGKLEAKLKKLQSDFDAEVEARAGGDELSKKLKDQLTQREAELEEEKNNNNNLNKIKKEIEKKVKQLEDDLHSTQSNLSDLEALKKNLATKIQDLEGKAQENEEQIEELEENKRKADLTIADLKKRLADAEATIARLEREKKALEARVQELQSQLDEEAKDKQALSRDQRMLAEEIENLNRTLDSEGNTAATLQQRLQKSEKEVKQLNEKLRAEQDGRTQTEADLAKANNELTALRSDFEESENKVRALTNKKRELETANEELKDQVDSLNANIESMKRQVATFKREADELNLQLTEQTDLLEESASALSKAKRAADALRSDLAVAQDEITRGSDAQRLLKQQLEEAEGLRNIAEQKASALEKAKAKADSDLKDLQAQLAEQTAKIQAGERANKKLQKKNATLASEIEAAREAAKGDLEAQLNQVKEELRAASENLEASLKAQRSALQDKETTSRELIEVRAQLDEALSAKQRLDRQVKNLQEEMDNLSEEIESSVMEKFDDLKRNHSKALESVRIELDSAQNAARLSDDKNKRLQRDVEEATRSADEATNRANTLDRDLANVRTSYDELKKKAQQDADALAKAQKDLSKANKAITRLREEVEEASGKVPESELRKLHEQVEDYERQLEEERRAKANLERERDQLTNDIRQVNLELEEEQRNKSTAVSNLKKAQFERDDLSQRLEEAEEELDQARVKVSKLTAEVEGVRRNFGEAEDGKRRAEATLASVGNELANARSELQSTQTAKSDLENQLKQFQTDLEATKAELETERAAKAKAENAAKKQKKLAAANQTAVTTLEGQLKESRDKAKSFEDQVATLELQVRDATNEKDNLRSQLNNMESDKVMAERKYKETQIQLEDLRSEADTIQRNLAKAEQQAKKLKKQLQVTKEDCEREARAKAQETAKASALDSELRTLKSKFSAEENKARILEDDKRKLDTQLQTAQREVRTLKTQLDESREDLERERKRAAERQRKMAKMLE